MYIGISFGSFQHTWKPVKLPMLSPFLPDAVILNALRSCNHRWRSSLLKPVTLVWSMIYRALHPDHSIRNVVEHLATTGIFITESAWCQARSRLPVNLFHELSRHVALKAVRGHDQRNRWLGRDVFIVDGTTASMPDSPGLVEVFGYAKVRYGPSKFPVARVVALLHAGTHEIVDYRTAPYDTAENGLWRQMIDDLPEGSIVLGDCYFCTIPDLTLLHRRHIDLVAKLHARRCPQALIRKGFRLSHGEWLAPFETSGATRRTHADEQLPEVIWVRLIRHRYRHNGKRHTAWIVTSLTNAARYSKAAVIALYRSRWGIETHMNYLKTTLEMSVLRSMTPAAIESEIGAIILAHNLIYRLMAETARTCNIAMGRLSFASAIKTTLQNDVEHQVNGRTRRGCARLLALNRLAARCNLDRPGRVEPRLIKRDKVRYGYLRTSRAAARKAG